MRNITNINVSVKFLITCRVSHVSFAIREHQLFLFHLQKLTIVTRTITSSSFRLLRIKKKKKKNYLLSAQYFASSGISIFIISAVVKSPDKKHVRRFSLSLPEIAKSSASRIGFRFPSESTRTSTFFIRA